MKIKRGLKRVWILGTILWVIILAWFSSYSDGALGIGIGGLVIWWALYWGISGFFEDDEKEETGKGMDGEA